MLRIFAPVSAAIGDATARLELTPAVAGPDQRTGRAIDGVLGPPTVGDRGTSRDATFLMPLERLAPGEYTARAVVQAGGAVVADVRRTVEIVVGAPPAADPAPIARARDVLEGAIAAQLLAEAISGGRASHSTAAAAIDRRAWQDAVAATTSAPPDDPIAQRLRGIALLATEQYAASAAALAAAFRADATDARLAFVLGWAETGAGRRPAAIAAFRNAAFLDPTMVAAHIALCETYLAGGNVDLARQAVSAGIRAVPDSIELKRLSEKIGR
jgi:hypothetical protein